MQVPSRFQRLMAEYEALLAAQKSGPLTSQDLQRLEFLKDVLLEAGSAMESEGAQRPPRAPRATVALEVQFGGAADAARAYTRDISAGGLALSTEKPLPQGTRVNLQVKVPGMAESVRALGSVVWSRPGAMGIAFETIEPEAHSRLKQLVVEHTSLLTRLSALFGKAGGPAPARLSGGGAAISIAVSDEILADVAAELLGLHGFVVYDGPPEGRAVDVAVVDAQSLAAVAAASPEVPLVVVNSSGPEVLVGKLAALRPRAWIKRPASAASVLDAVRRALPRAGSAPVAGAIKGPAAKR
jgi:uncharacterized protein (TIGR02266 family)